MMQKLKVDFQILKYLSSEGPSEGPKHAMVYEKFFFILKPS